MSEFDKEAEREKLREKFERDREKRQATQRMSELLLKGATMTNHHCDNCGDPIFRYDGQEFCPTCQSAQQTSVPEQGTNVRTEKSLDAGVDGTSDGAAAETSAPAEGDASAGIDTSTGESPPADGETTTAADEGGVDATPSEPSVADARSETTPTPNDTTAERSAPNADDATIRVSRETRQSASASTPTDAPETGGTDPTAGGDAADLGEARASLVRTVTRYARKAEATDDPRRARELLAAAREAAETLAALDR